MTALAAYVDGVGLLAPGISDWPAGARLLAGRHCGAGSTVVRLALAVGLEATARAGADPAALAAVFASSGGDGQNCHEICQVLASSERQLSPTRFHNSVHNAAAS